ncbi:MAG: hypothetical protein Q8S13_02080 [Dehalococcoidia bacterium]|nr:hypothetical protein [Dehalococcoidia bacterium]
MPAFLKAIVSADGSKKAGAFAIFLAATAAVAATGGVTWPAWLATAKWAFGLYVGGQAAVDVADRIRAKP